MDERIVIGVDLGTSGVRALAVRGDGRVAATAQVGLESARRLDEGGRHEQDPRVWWELTAGVLRQLTAALAQAGLPAATWCGVAVDGTSGTLVCLDRSGAPVRHAIMYNDARAGAEAESLNEQAADFCARLGYRFAASYALAKLEWVRRHEPEMFARTAHFLHQGDYIEACLVGDWGTSDYSNALKTGYDLLDNSWPAWLANLAGVRERLPRVVAPGTAWGQVSVAAAAVTGLPVGLPVIAGATDGTAACLASGVRRPGDYNTTLGTTLVFKGISQQLGRHAQGLVYSHKLPGGRWLPGAASNTGGEWIETAFPGRDLAALDQAAAALLPTACLAYPLARQGERFPFLAPAASGFWLPPPADEATRFAAGLQGTALIERLAYAVIDQVAGTTGGEVYSTGGGSRSAVWMQCRADATGRVIHRPAYPESAFGSAVLAAAGTLFGQPWEAVSTMVRLDRSFPPQPQHRAAYDELYSRFTAQLRERGWIATEAG